MWVNAESVAETPNRGKEVMKSMLICRTMVIAVFFLMLHSGSALAASGQQTGGVLPDIDLPVPEDATRKSYLGLSGEGLFQIPQIKAEVVIIEIFSMY